jgi:hypothetical protein
MKKLLLNISYHLKQSFVWSRTHEVEELKMLISSASLAGPIVLGACLHDLRLGTSMAIAGYLVGTDAMPDSFFAKIQLLFADIIAFTFAAFLGASIAAPSGLNEAVFIFVAGTAAFLGAAGKWASRTSMLFTIMVIIGRNLGQHGASATRISGLFLLGSLWISFLILIVQPLLQRFIFRKRLGEQATSPLTDKIRLPAKSDFFQISNWLYVARLVISLIIAELFLYFVPIEHSYWIYLTIVIVVLRNPQDALQKKIQRTMGTLIGVIAGSLLLIWHPPLWIGISLIAILAAARPWIKMKNYAAYSTLMTVFVLLLINLSQPSIAGTLIDRILAAFMGSAISFVFGYLIWFRFFRVSTSSVN